MGEHIYNHRTPRSLAVFVPILVLTPFQLLVVAVIVALAVFIVSGLKARERANVLAREYCHKRELQFLDGTVSLLGIAPVRSGGRWYLRRRYRFDYTAGTPVRYTGTLVLVGLRLDAFLLSDEHVTPE